MVGWCWWVVLSLKCNICNIVDFELGEYFVGSVEVEDFVRVVVEGVFDG